MISLVERALQAALLAHLGQIDKGGDQPYILHPLRMGIQMMTDEDFALAILHDVLEHSSMDIETLAAEPYCIPRKILDDLMILVRRSEEPYFDYIQRILEEGSPAAIQIKMAELRDNMNLVRLDHDPTAEELSRQAQYQVSLGMMEASEKSATMMYIDARRLIDLCIENGLLRASNGHIETYRAAGSNPKEYPAGWYLSPYEDCIQEIMRNKAGQEALIQALAAREITFTRVGPQMIAGLDGILGDTKRKGEST